MGSRLLEPWVHTGPCFRHETLHFELGNREAIVFYGTTSELNWMLRQHPSRWTHKSTMQHTRELRNESQQGCRNCLGPSGRKWCKIPPSPTPPLSSHFVCKLELAFLIYCKPQFNCLNICMMNQTIRNIQRFCWFWALVCKHHGLDTSVGGGGHRANVSQAWLSQWTSSKQFLEVEAKLKGSITAKTLDLNSIRDACCAIPNME